MKKQPIAFSVDRHDKVTKFSADIARNVIRKGVEILADDDEPKGTDVPTDVPLELSGDKVGIFYDGDGIVKNQKDLDALLTKPGDVHVVCEIHCCGGEKPGILGCSGFGRAIVVTEGIGLCSAAVLWMHELGHRKGLCHRDRDDEFAIMDPTILVTNKTVNQYEHNVFEGATPRQCNQDKKKRPEKIDVIKFVHKVFIEGVPYEQGSQYTTGDDIHRLEELLDNPEEQRSWLNAIAVLGMIGDRQAWMPIKQAFERGSGELSRENYAAKLAVPLSLGYLIAKGHDPHDQEILEYLNTGLKPGEWSTRVHWRQSHDQDDQTRNAHLTMLTILGLGISGRTEALTALQTLYDQLEMQAANLHGESLTKTDEATTSNRIAGLSEYEPGTLSVLKAAIQTNKRVHEDGLVKYYRDSELEQLGFNL